MENICKDKQVAQTYRLLDRMHRAMGLDIKALDTYDVGIVEELLAWTNNACAAAVLARTSLELFVAEYMAALDQEEVQIFLPGNVTMGFASGDNPARDVELFAEVELEAAMAFTRKAERLLRLEKANASTASLALLEQMSLRIIEAWSCFRARNRCPNNSGHRV